MPVGKPARVIGNPAALLAACCLVLPGVPVTLLLRRERNLAGDFSASALFGILIVSLPVWFPPARVVPLTEWTIGLLSLSAASALLYVFATISQRNRKSIARSARHWGQLTYVVPWVILSLGYVTVLLTRPLLEWDAVNYYLPAAQNYVALNHFSNFWSPGFTIGSHIPVGWPPLIPWLCALATEVASIFHQSADRGIRLIPLVYLVILWIAAYQTAHATLPRRYAQYAALLTASMPLLLFSAIAQAFYLDIPIAACFVALIAAVFCEGGSAKPIVIGAWALLAVLTKITGLPLIMALAFCFLIYYSGGIKSRVAMVFSLAALVIVSANLHLLANFTGFTQWIVLGGITTLYWFAIPHTAPPHKIGLRPSLLVLLAFSPSIWYFIERVKTSGGLWEYSIPGHAAFHPPNWDWANRLILQSHLLDTYAPQGVREHLGIGLLLWWGFSPVVALFALYGAVLAIRKQSALRLPLTICAMVIVIWLTAFHSQDYRPTLPILPFEAIFAVYGIAGIFAGVRSLGVFVTACCFLINIPLLWIAQQNYYASPVSKSLFNQDAAWTTYTFLFTLLASGVCVMMVWRLRSLKQSAVPKRYFTRTAIAGMISVSILASFEPVVATGLSASFEQNRQKLSAQVFDGYLQALPLVRADRRSGLVGFLAYGIPWFTEGTVRKIDLLDAIDLATLRDTLRSGDVTQLVSTLRVLGAAHAILPAPDSPYYSSYRQFLNTAGLKAVQGLYDPLFSTQSVRGAWDVLDIEPNSSWNLACSPKLDVFAPVFRVTLRHCGALRRAEIDIAYKGGDEVPTGLFMHRTSSFILNNPSHVYTLPIRVDTLPDRNKFPIITIKSIKLTVANEHNDIGFMNWRSPHFAVTFKAHSKDTELSGDVFVSHPERALISYVSLANANGLQEVRLYPRPLGIFGELNGTLPIYGKIVTRESFGCKAGAPTLLTVKASVWASGKVLRADRSLRTKVGETVLIDVNRWLDETGKKFGKVQWIRWSEITARGLAPSCRAQETIGVQHVVLVKSRNALSFLPGTQALVISDVK